MNKITALAMTLCLGCTASGFAADAKATFYLPFEDSTAPAISAGGQKDFKSGKAKFEPGRIGKGVRVQEILKYANTANISMEKGTLCFFYAPDVAPKAELDAYNKDKKNKPTIEVLFRAQHLGFYISGWSGCFMTGYYEAAKAGKQPRFRWSYDLQSGRMWRWSEPKKFHHIAVTWDRTKGGLRVLYFDGEKVAQVANMNMPTEIAAAQAMEIGKKGTRGVIDEFIIYDQPLTAEQIKRHAEKPEEIAKTLLPPAKK